MSPAAGPPIPVIDMWAPIVPSREVIVELRAGFPVEQLQYLEVFAKRKVSTSEFAAYAASLEREDEQIVAALDAAGIVRSLITGFDEHTTCGVTFVANESIAAIASRWPERVIPFAGADIMRGPAAAFAG